MSGDALNVHSKEVIYLKHIFMCVQWGSNFMKIHLYGSLVIITVAMSSIAIAGYLCHVSPMDVSYFSYYKNYFCIKADHPVLISGAINFKFDFLKNN